MKKRLLSLAMALCMVLSLLPATAFADENAETPVCTCEEACTAEDMDAECPVCGAEGASVEDCCKYTVPATEAQPEATTPPEAPVCTCEGACTAEAMNAECPVCSAEGASVEDCCKYVAPEQDGSTEATTPQEAPVCSCEDACTADAMDAECPVCGAEGAVVENCGKYIAPVVEEQVEEVVQQGAPAGEEPELTAVEKVQAMIDALPTVEELENADDETVDAVYSAVQDVCDAMDELSTEELDQLTGLDKLAALMEWFTGPVSTYEEDYPYLDYTIEDNGTITITGLKDGYKDTTDVTIPAKIGGYDVTAIGGWSFENCKNITRVNLPASITSIGKNAFKNCTNLESINIPYGVTSIGWYAFAGCTKLASITIPSSVTTIEIGVFQNCTCLTSITIPSSVTWIKDSAFRGCAGLTSLTIPSSVTRIDGWAFENCTSLTSVTIPSSVTEFYEGIFCGCTGLTSVTIPSSMTKIPTGTFSSCTGLTSITIPNSVKEIRDNAFFNCSGLKDVYYLGTKEEWGNILINTLGNTDLIGNVRCVGDINQGFSFTPPSNLTYDGEAKEATVTKNNDGYGAVTIKYYDQSGQVYTAGPIDAGTYTVKIDIEQSQTYDAISDYEVGRFTILQAENSFTTDLSIEGWTYGDTPKAPDAAAKFGTLTYSYSTEKDGTYTTTQPTNAGTYWVKATVDKTDNYTGLEDKIQFTILPKTYTVTYAAGSYGSGTVAAGSKTHDVAFTLSSETFTRAGYEQTGWAISDGGEKVYDLGGTYTANEDITLYPVWSHEHTDTNPKDHVCDICGTTLSQHTGGEATCTSKAVCEYCGKEYGELDSTNHNLEKVPAKAATVTETGNIEYWQCKDCGDLFSDPDGKDKIELEDTVTEKLPPEIIKGKGQSVTEGEKNALSFTSNAAFSDFIRVELDGKTLDAKNYTVKEGSTVVTLNADYVGALSAGEHTIGIVSESGTATTTFTVNAKVNSTDSSQTGTSNTNSPQTGDNSPLALWIALLFVSGGLLAVTGIYGKKKKYNK